MKMAKRLFLSLILLMALSWSSAQEFLSLHELTEKHEVDEMPVHSAEAIFIAATNDISITTSNKSVDLVAAPVRKKDGTYEYVVILDLSGGHTDRHFTVEKRGTTFRATTKRKTLFATGDRRYFFVEEPTLKVMLTQPVEKPYMVKNEACVEFISPYPNLRIDTSALLGARIVNSLSEGKAFVTSVMVNTSKLDNLRELYGDALPELWEELTTLTVRFDSSNANSVSVAGLEQRVKLQYNIVPVSGGGKGMENPNLLNFSFSPSEAVIRIDGELIPSVQGKASAYVSAGRHQYDIECPYYHTVSDTVNIVSGQRDLEIALKPAFGYLKVSGDRARGATVLINGKEVGTAPYTSDRLTSGNYTVELVKDLHLPYKENVTISDGETYELMASLVVDYAHVTFAVNNDADIYINGEKMAQGHYISDFRTGTYVVEARKSGHTSTLDTFNIIPAMMDQVIVLKSPTPLYGLLAIRTKPAKALVSNADSLFCTTPRVVRTLVGDYDLTIYKSKRDTIYVKANLEARKCLEVKVQLPKSGKKAGNEDSNFVKMKYVRVPVAYVRGTLFSVNTSYTHPYNLWSYGLTVGRLRRFGWSLALNTNFHFQGLNSKTPPAHAVATDSNITYFGATLGLVMRTCNPLSVRVGAGVGYYAANFKMGDGKWYAPKTSKVFGLQTDIGLIFHAHPLILTIDYSTVMLRFHNFRVGLGFYIQKSPHAITKTKKDRPKKTKAP